MPLVNPHKGREFLFGLFVFFFSQSERTVLEWYFNFYGQVVYTLV